MAQRVPYTGDEKESLQASLNRHRDAVLWKLEGLDDADLRRAKLPSGNTLLGLVKHLATWEYAWICRTEMFGDTVSLRWVVIHVLEDTARHAGHIDIMRELIDGMIGFHQRAESTS